MEFIANGVIPWILSGTCNGKGGQNGQNGKLSIHFQ
jgi:hypothetical protein